MIAIAALLLAVIDTAPQDAASITITLQRTACFGACPEYTVTLRGDGTVVYQGRRNVRVAGTHTWTIADDVPKMVRELARAGFFDLEDEYTAPITDLPTTYLSVTVGGQTKKVKDYFGAPPILKMLEARIDAVTGAKGYVRISGEAIHQMMQKGWRATGEDAVRWMNEAAAGGDADVVVSLLDAGANARMRDVDGVTLVMKAAASGDPLTVHALLAAGADPTARDRAGRNAADRARDGLADARPGRTVPATGKPCDYAAVLRALTDEHHDDVGIWKCGHVEI